MQNTIYHYIDNLQRNIRDKKITDTITVKDLLLKMLVTYPSSRIKLNDLVEILNEYN